MDTSADRALLLVMVGVPVTFSHDVPTGFQEAIKQIILTAILTRRSHVAL